MRRYDFLLDTFETEALKTLSMWSQFKDSDMQFRPEPRARTPHEHMVHQCVSEDIWMRTMLAIDIGASPLPERETRLEFLRRYAEASEKRLVELRTKQEDWYEETTNFFDVERTRAWVLSRRIAHTSHHRGQLTIYLRILGRELYSTYGPTADTGGLFQNQAPVIYRYADISSLLDSEAQGGKSPALPGVGDNSPTERPGPLEV